MDMIDAKRYDRGMSALNRLSIARLRNELVRGIEGNVLEIGAGTGANFALYGPQATVTAIDLREGFLRSAAQKAAATPPAAPAVAPSVALANAQHLPFAAGTFDAVVATLVFCSIGAPEEALREICRVLRPNGTLNLLEHVRGQGTFSRLFTDLLHPLWFAAQGECHLNRETANTLVKTGYSVVELSTHGKGLLQLIRATPPGSC